MNNTFQISEYGLIRCQEDYEVASNLKSLKEIYLSKIHFDDLFEFIMQSQDEKKEGERMFSIFSKGKKRQIKTKNFVGVIETQRGLTLEILPKIFFNSADYQWELENTKKVFLKMLSRLKNSPFLNISSAHLKTQPNFPILEVFIENYINEVRKIIRSGFKSQYVQQEENLNFLKGKINNSQNIKNNHSNRAKFYCQFDEFSEDMVYNQLLKSTLLKLNKISKSHKNRTSIIQLLSHFDIIKESKDFKSDFQKTTSSNRLYSSYSKVISWSETFLSNKSFTNFNGDSKNMAILFPMERIFEDYIGFIMKKHANGSEVKTQDRSYYLVDSHNGNGKFRLKPDIVATDDSSASKVIIDTKWKILDDSLERKNYNISQADMYQLYAYGRKYALNGDTKKSPRLVLLYPANNNFSKKLSDFIYEGDLILHVLPFNLNKILEMDGPKEEILAILDMAFNETTATYPLKPETLSIAAEPAFNYGEQLDLPLGD